jgi:hypothetical protein
MKARSAEDRELLDWTLGCAIQHKDFFPALRTSIEVPAEFRNQLVFLINEGCSKQGLLGSLALAQKLPSLLPSYSPRELRSAAADLETAIGRMKALLPPRSGGISAAMEKQLRAKVRLYRELAASSRPRKDAQRRVARAIPGAYVIFRTGQLYSYKVADLLTIVGIDVGDNYTRDVSLAQEDAGVFLDRILDIISLWARSDSLEIIPSHHLPPRRTTK